MFCIINTAHASEIKLNFTVTQPVDISDTTLHTSIEQLAGDIVWSTNKTPSHPYHVISGLVANGYGPTAPYWLVIGMPAYLRITFPEPIYISKIRTYNIGMTSANYGPAPVYGNRWAESSLFVTSEGIQYDIGDIRVDDSPHEMDFVDLIINRYVTQVEYIFENITQPDHNYYAINRVEMYTTTQTDDAIPEPTSIICLLAGCFSIVLQRMKNK